MTKKEQEKPCNDSILRACYILDLFTVENDKWILRDIAAKCGISPTTAIPVLRSLEKCGYLERDPETKQYSLGIRFLEKSQIKINSMNIIDISAKVLKNFSKKYSVNTHLGRLEGGDVIYLDRHEAVVHSLSPSYVGKRIPAYCSSMGKALLAHLEYGDLIELLRTYPIRKITFNTKTEVDEIVEELKETLARGYAIDDEEYQARGYCIAVPIYDVSGRVCAAISCSTTKTPENMKNIPTLQKAMIDAGKEISAALGYGCLYE